MSKKFYLVTGANKGIGFALVEKILKGIDGSYVFLGSRNKDRGIKAVETLVAKDKSYENRVEVIGIDVSKQNSISKAAVEVGEKLKTFGGKLSGLVNNAGVYEGSTIGNLINVNIKGVHYVTEAMVPLLHENEGRVVNLSSMLSMSFLGNCNKTGKAFFSNSQQDWKELEPMLSKMGSDENFLKEQMSTWGVKSVSSNSLYSMSKGFVNLLTKMQAQRYPKLKINCCHPGFVFTDMTKNFAGGDKTKAKNMGMISTEEGIVSSFHLLTADLKSNGCYYNDRGVLIQ